MADNGLCAAAYGRVWRTHKDAAGVSVLARACKGALQAQEGAGLALALGLGKVHPPLDLHKAKQVELCHQNCACAAHSSPLVN